MIQPDTSDNALWKQRFRAPSIAWAAVAKDNPARGLACTNKDGIFQLCAWGVDSGALTQLTDQPAGVTGGTISPNGEYIYYHHDEAGNEIGHYVRVPFIGGEPEDITPDMPPYGSFDFSLSKSGSHIGFMAADKEGFKIYSSANGAAPEVLYQSAKMAFGPQYAHGGEIAVVHSTERTGTVDTSLIAIDTASDEQIGELWDGDDTSIQCAGFSPIEGDFRLIGTSSRSGYERPLIWNPRTSARSDLGIDEIPGDVSPWGWSPDGKRVLLSQLHQAIYQLYVYHLDTQTLTKLDHPQGVLGGGYFASDDEIFVTWQDAMHPSRLIALDAQTGKQRRVVLDAGAAPDGRRWQSVTFTGANGDPIQAWLATPEGQGPFPTILHTHGGPGVTTETFAPVSQAWLDHGFAFFTINYHGSTTFGKAFEKSIWGNLGDLEVADMAAAYRWLVDNHIAKPDAVLLTGDSYGGYLTLQAIGKAPDLWAGGMAIVAIADWFLMYEDQAETLRDYQRAIFGGTPDEKPDAHRSSSPITYAEHIQAPILVIQGANDTRCPPRQMQAYEEKLKSLGKSIKVHWFDAGHDSQAMEQQIEQQEMMLQFAYEVLTNRTGA